MQWFSLLGAVISAVAVAAAYRVGYAQGYSVGQEAGYGEGKRAGTKEGSVRGFAVGYDRGKRAVQEREAKPGHAGGSTRVWQPALLVLSVGILVLVVLATQSRRQGTMPTSKPTPVIVHGPVNQ